MLNRISEETTLREEELKRIEREYTADQDRSKVASSSGKLSQLLRRQRQSLPSPRTLEASIAARRAMRGEIDLERIERTIDLEALAARERVAALDPSEQQYQELLRAQREEYLRPLQKTLDSISTSLETLEKLEGRLVDGVRKYQDFIDEQVMWLRSGPEIWAVGADALAEDFRAIVDPIRSAEQWRLVGRQIMLAPAWAYIGLGVGAALILARPLVRRWLERLAKEVTRGHSDRFVLTLEALVATILLSMAVPIAMAGLGLSLRSNEVGSPLAGALGAALLGTAKWTALLLFARRLVRRQGLAVDHFSWRSEQSELLLGVTTRLVRWTVPLLFLSILCARLPQAEGARPIATLVFAPCLLLLSWAAWRLFRPSAGLFSNAYREEQASLARLLRWTWFPLVVGLPLAALVLAVLGWSWAGAVLIDRFVASAALALGTAVLASTLTRALEFGARALARRSSAQATQTPQAIEISSAVKKKEIRADVAAVSRQTRLTIRALSVVILVGGLVLIWRDLVPALRTLDTIKLWQGADAPVSLGALLWALAIGVAAIFAAANLPGAIEIMVLQHAGMSAAGRYAATAVMRYAIAIVAVILIGAEIGITWNSVQWLVAAISVGLGFGLQEVVGNFVSGLIVLFEQPVRVGDLITVGDRTGMVTKIRIRATTIRDPDGKDLIIPNKHLITERVTNWTLSGSPLRLVIPIGVAYGTDLSLAERLLLDATKSVPAILDNPPPTPQLMGFGSSSIDFELRVHVAKLEELLPTRHAIMKAVQSVFGDAGVSIAFPQLDVHIDPAMLDRFAREVER